MPFVPILVDSFLPLPFIAGPTTKMTRFSNTVAEISNVLTWWDTLSSVEQANIEQIDRLVECCELSFQQERQAWVSTSMASKMLSKSMKIDKPDADKDGKDENV